MRLTTTVWRAHHPRWSFAPESGDGAARFGGRFNKIGQPALYTAMRPETAMLEAQQGFPFKAQPMTLCGYAVDCDDIADLTNPATIQTLGITYSNLSCAWEDLAARGVEPITWTIAMRLIGMAYAGIIVPSFAAGATANDRNVVFWDWASTPPHQVKVIDDYARLPKNDLSWR